MADTVQEIMEEMVPELQDLAEKSIFNAVRPPRTLCAQTQALTGHGCTTRRRLTKPARVI